MDYVLFGMGYGATLMLLGWALRTFGPERKYRDVHPEDIEQVVAQRRWVRFIQGLGGVIAIVGIALVLFTFIVMLVNPDDDTGSFIALVIWGFLALAVLIWCWFYVSSYGLVGIWSRQDGYGFRRTSSSSARSATDEAISTARVVPAPRVLREEGAPPLIEDDSMNLDEPTPGDLDTASGLSAHKDDAPTLQEDPEAGEPNEEAETQDPEYDFGDSADTTVPSEIGGRSEAIRRLRERQARSGNSTESR